jgi:hypothetical protein
VATYGTFVDDVVLTAAETNDFLVWQTFIPEVFQPSLIALSASNRYAKYAQVNKLVIGSIALQVGGVAGTGGNRLEFALPVTAASNSVKVIGVGWAENWKRLCIIRVSTTRAAVLRDNSVATSGIDTALGAGVGLSFNFMYEAA